MRQNGDSTARAASRLPERQMRAGEDRHALDRLRLASRRTPRSRLADRGSRDRARVRCCCAAPRRPAIATEPARPSAISPLDTPAWPLMAIAQVKICRSSASSGRLSRYSRAPATSPAASASSPAFSVATSRLSEGAIVTLGSARSGMADVSVCVSRSVPSAACGGAGGEGAHAIPRRAPALAPARRQGRRSSGNAACPWA